MVKSLTFELLELDCQDVEQPHCVKVIDYVSEIPHPSLPQLQSMHTSKSRELWSKDLRDGVVNISIRNISIEIPPRQSLPSQSEANVLRNLGI